MNGQLTENQIKGLIDAELERDRPPTDRTVLAPVLETIDIETPQGPVTLVKPKGLDIPGMETSPLQRVPILREEVNPAWMDYHLRKAIGREREGESPLLPDAAQYWVERVPFTGAIWEAEHMYNALNSARRIERGNATALDFARMADLIVRMDKEGKRGWFQRTVDLMTELPGFATEFAATGGFYAAGKSGTKKALQILLRKQIKDRAVNALTSAVGVGLQTLANPQLIARNLAYNLADNLDLNVNERGQLEVMFKTTNDDFKSALQRALIQSGVELGTERMGFLLGQPLSGLKAAVARRWLKPGAPAGRTVKSLQKALRAVRWHGVIEEIFEERMGEALSFLSGDPYEPPSWQDIASEAVAFSMPMLAMAGSRAIDRRRRSLAERLELEKLEEQIRELTGRKPSEYSAADAEEDITRSLPEREATPVDVDRFYEALQRTHDEHPHGRSVQVKDRAFYSDPTTRLFFSDDQLAGAAVTADGDLVSVFKHPSSKTDINPLLAEASRYAVSLDAFDYNGKLPELYARHGFRPAAQVPWDPNYAPEDWDYETEGTPDVVLMVRDTAGITGLPEIGGKGSWAGVKDQVPMHMDYDSALAIQQRAIASVRQGRTTPRPVRQPSEETLEIHEDQARYTDPVENPYRFDEGKRSLLGARLANLLERYVAPERLSKLRSDTLMKLAEMAKAMPRIGDLVKLAEMGRHGRRWYQLATEVLRSLVGERDVHRFVGLLAAASPNKGVTDSIPIALKTWKLWNEAGRPTDPARLRKLLFRAPGSKEFHKPIYLPADLGNAIAALSSDSFEEAYNRMSDRSPKVKPFYAANMGNLDAVVLDVWMSRLFGIDPNDIGNVVENVLGNLWSREVARRLGWEPAEAQAAMWAASRVIGDRLKPALRTKRERQPRMRDILDREVTDELLMPGDDIASLLVQGYRTKRGDFYDYPTHAEQAGLNVAAARATYEQLAPGLLEPTARTTARTALGTAGAGRIARRLERAYAGEIVLREAGPGQPAITLPVHEDASEKELEQLELALSEELSGSVSPGIRSAREPSSNTGKPSIRKRIAIYTRAIAKELLKKGKVDIRGKEVTDISEAAALFQLYRDPRFETFRWIFTRGNEVVGTYGITARRPGSTVIFAPGDGWETIDLVMRQLGADGFFITHNHPTGNPSPSDADIHATLLIAESKAGFRGHVVTDHNFYSVINRLGFVNGYRINERGQSEEVELPEADERISHTNDPLYVDPQKQQVGFLLGRSVHTPEDAAQLAMVLKAFRKHAGIGLIFSDARNQARGFAEVAVNDLVRADFVSHLRNTARGLGAHSVIGFYEGDDQVLSSYQQKMRPGEQRVSDVIETLVRSQVFRDFLHNKLSIAEKTGALRSDVWFGLTDTGQALSEAAMRVEEPSMPYGHPPITPETKQRKFAKQIEATEELSPELQAAAGQERYTPIPAEATVSQAMALVQQNGLNRSLNMLRDEGNGLSEAVRVTLGEAIIRIANQRYRENRDVEALDISLDAANFTTEYGTRLGQGVQAFANWGTLLPEAIVRNYQRQIDRVRRRKLARAGITAGAGALTKELEKKLKLPQYQKDVAERILKMAIKAHAKPEGFQRDEAMIDVMAEIARQKGISPWDLTIALWYANILSGWTTQARNLFGTMSQVALEFGTHAVARPSTIPDLCIGLFQGAGRGVMDAWRVLRTGKITGTRIKKMEVPRVLELKKYKGIFRPLNAWKHVFRVMAACDMTFFRSAEEMKARFLARTIARNEGLRGAALNNRMAEILFQAPQQRKQAEAQARAEGLTGMQYRRRVFEIQEQNRPEALVKQAADYGRFATFNQEPQGALGVFARMIASGTRQFPPLRLLVPFTHVVANVSNNALDYTPWGYLRLFNLGNPNGELAPNYGTEEFRLQAARATLGTLGFVALYGLALMYADDEDPWFSITAQGPSDPNKRNQLRQTGWTPFSVKIGKFRFTYQFTSLHMGLAVLGNLLDAKRYQKLDDADALNRAYFVMSRVPHTIISQSFLAGLSDFFTALSRTHVPKSGNQFGGLARTASSMVIPNLVKQIDRFFDPNIYQANTVQAALLRDIPVARSGLRPMINVLGQRIKMELNPFIREEGTDRLWRTIAKKQAFISCPDKLTMLGDRPMTPGEYYVYVLDSGQRIRERLEPKLDLLDSMDRETAQNYVRKVVREERTNTKRQLFGMRR